MKKSHLILILLVSCALLCGTVQAVTLRINVADDSTGEAIADASIYIDGNYIGKTASDGTYSYVHSSTTDLYLKVVKKGYRDWVDYVDYDATRVYVDMIPEDVTLTVELYDATTLEPIVGAVVRVEADDYSDSDVSGSSGSVNFAVKAGEVYNVGGRPEWEREIKDYSDMILKAVGRDDSLVTYEEAEPFTTKVKTMDFTKAIRDLGHDPRVTPEEGIRRTVEWMKQYYRIEE